MALDRLWCVVADNGQPWTEFNKDRDIINREVLTGQVAVTAQC